MESHSLLPSNNTKLEPVSDVGQPSHIKPEPPSGMTQCFYIKPEPASEVRPSNGIKPESASEMRPSNGIKPESASEMRPSNCLKLESVSQTDCAASSTEEILIEITDCDQMESKTPASVKIEPPEVYIDYPGQGKAK
ncbi:hypothetical protein BsWGS_29072 [Bradybaena similaris]